MANEELLTHAKQLYMDQRLEPTQIAEQIGRSEATVYRWISKYAWERERLADDLSFTKLGERLARHIHLIEQAATAENRSLSGMELRLINQIVALVEKLSNKTMRYAHGLEALSLLDRYLQTKDPDLCQKLKPHLANFAREFSSIDGEG